METEMKNIKTSVPAEVGKRYLRNPDGSLIPLDPLPEGFFVMHNNRESCGYRIWIQEGSPKLDRLIRCRCDLGSDLDAAEIPIHFRYPKRSYTVWVVE
jgi:hypothetical protein